MDSKAYHPACLDGVIENEIVHWAKAFNDIEEIPDNMGWEDIYFVTLGMKFQDYMKGLGWKPTHAWCCYHAEGIWKVAYSRYDRAIAFLLDTLFSGSVRETKSRFERAGYLLQKEPKKGALAIWLNYRNGKQTGSGHIGIVESWGSYYFHTYEGNSNDKSEKRKRTYNWNGNFKLMGFIHPIKIN